MDHIDTLVNRLRAYSQSLVAYKLDADFADACTDAADKLEKLQAQNSRLNYSLMGVMHSVDKWLEGDELNADEVQRAATMREKTLGIVEKLQAELRQYENLDEQLSDECALRDEIAGLRAKLDEAKSNYEQLREENHNIVKTGEQMYQQAICDIPHNCHTCMHRIDPMCPGNKAKNSFGFQENCASWQWRGMKEA